MRRISKGIAPFVALALVVAACGDDDDDGGEAEPTEEAPEPTEAPETAETMTEETAETMTEETAETMTEETAEPTTPPPAAEIATDVGVTDEAIKIGFLADLTGLFSSTVVPLTDGSEAYWDRVNANGGVAGRQVEYITVDTGYDVPTHQQFYDQFSSTGEEGVAFIGFSTGSPHTASIRSDLEADGLGAIPLSWNSSWATDASANIFEWGTPYCVEAMNGVSWLAEQNSATKLAIISFPGDYGEDGAIGAKYAAEQLGLEVVYDGQAAVIPGADQTPVISGIVDSGAEIVWTTINPTALADIMGQAVAGGFTGQWGGNGPSYAPALMGTEVAPALDQYYTHFQPYAGLAAVESEGMTDVLAMMREQRPDAPFVGVYVISWIQGEILRQGLELAAAAGDMTREGIVTALQSNVIPMGGVIADLNYSGDPNDQVIRSSYVYDIASDAYSATATVQDDQGDGTVLIDPDYTSDAAANWDYAPCFEI